MDDAERYQHANEILRAVGHDLKSPLTAVIGALEAMNTMGPRLSEQQRDIFCRLALKESYRLQHFVQNIMVLARLDSGAFDIQKTDMKLQDLLHPLRDRMVLEHPHVTIVMEEAPIMVKADSKWLTEALWQILDNAGRHNPQPVTLTIGTKNNQIMVGDNGMGIPDSLKATLFERHAKGPATIHQDASAGVGLTIAQAIFRAHGGDIHLLNGPGATFQMTTS
jgi:two-component system sensor histidine kinase KdpD